MADTSGATTVYAVTYRDNDNPTQGESLAVVQIIDGYTTFESTRRIIAIRRGWGAENIERVKIVTVNLIDPE